VKVVGHADGDNIDLGIGEHIFIVLIDPRQGIKLIAEPSGTLRVATANGSQIEMRVVFNGPAMFIGHLSRAPDPHAQTLFIDFHSRSPGYWSDMMSGS
jgi:hypothetical protein